MEKIPVKLSKFNNQSGQFDHMLTMDLTRSQLEDGLQAFNRAKRQEVVDYYKYEYTLNGEAIALCSVSPALFDPETVSV
jgi:hypothetical protein